MLKCITPGLAISDAHNNRDVCFCETSTCCDTQAKEEPKAASEQEASNAEPCRRGELKPAGERKEHDASKFERRENNAYKFEPLKVHQPKAESPKDEVDSDSETVAVVKSDLARKARNSIVPSVSLLAG